jgi:hypothetical protein
MKPHNWPRFERITPKKGSVTFDSKGRLVDAVTGQVWARPTATGYSGSAPSPCGSRPSGEYPAREVAA